MSSSSSDAFDIYGVVKSPVTVLRSIPSDLGKLASAVVAFGALDLASDALARRSLDVMDAVKFGVKYSILVYIGVKLLS